MSRIHVCPLARIDETVAATGARSLVTLLNPGTPVVRPAAISAARHLYIGVGDIVEPLEDHVLPAETHVAALLGFVDQMGSRRAAADPLLRRGQPLDRGGVHRRLRARAAARRGGDRARPARRFADRDAERAVGGAGRRGAGARRTHDMRRSPRLAAAQNASPGSRSGWRSPEANASAGTNDQALWATAR